MHLMLGFLVFCVCIWVCIRMWRPLLVIAGVAIAGIVILLVISLINDAKQQQLKQQQTTASVPKASVQTVSHALQQPPPYAPVVIAAPKPPPTKQELDKLAVVARYSGLIACSRPTNAYGQREYILQPFSIALWQPLADGRRFGLFGYMNGNEVAASFLVESMPETNPLLIEMGQAAKGQFDPSVPTPAQWYDDDDFRLRPLSWVTESSFFSMGQFTGYGDGTFEFERRADKLFEQPNSWRCGTPEDLFKPSDGRLLVKPGFHSIPVK